MRILIFGGTTEGKALSYELFKMGFSVTVCVATEYGKNEQGEEKGITVLEGRKDLNQIKELLGGFDFCIDATHPYAVEVTKNIKEASFEKNVPLLRLLREKSRKDSYAVYVEDAKSAAEALKESEGAILVATGAKELADFKEIDRKRLFVRVLPTKENIELCEKEGIPNRNIIAMQGPFSRELNEAVLRQFGIKFMVTKDGGKAGGFLEKIEAAKNVGVKTYVIKRPEDEGKSYDEILSLFGEMI